MTLRSDSCGGDDVSCSDFAEHRSPQRSDVQRWVRSMTDFAVTDSEVTEAVQRILGEVPGIEDADLTQSFHRLGGESYVR
jgi:hypothetical protein